MTGTADTATLPDWLSAIGTIAAVTIALLSTLLRWVWTSWARPRLTLETGVVEPHSRLAWALDGSIRHDFAYVRCMVRNDGRSPAHNVQALLTDWWEQDEDGIWIRRDLDPIRLHWVSLPVADAQGQPLPRTDLSPSQYDFLDLARFGLGRKEVVLLSHDPRVRGLDLQAQQPSGEQRVRIHLTSDDAKAVEQVFRFSFSSKKLVRYAEQSHAPIGEMRSQGILKLLGDAASDGGTGL